ncbi:unnamed protein product [Paramecium sonneborni]|uniref:Uncharacterized protein n=1 Tax=Paramecium sonneborni TaxID=65129 RepID=A0A8S1Q0I5_9CILI|nr:unnamed protein product [Paramecium sonneborni]
MVYCACIVNEYKKQIQHQKRLKKLKKKEVNLKLNIQFQQVYVGIFWQSLISVYLNVCQGQNNMKIQKKIHIQHFLG